jgi:hypothetical protein
VEQIVARAIREQWSPDAYAALGDLIELQVARSSTCASYTTYSDRLACMGLRLDQFSANSGRLLDPRLAARHGAFARAILPIRVGWLTEIAFTAVRNALDTVFFATGLWTACSAQGFATAQEQLLQTLEDLHVAAPRDQPQLQTEVVRQLTALTCPL